MIYQSKKFILVRVGRSVADSEAVASFNVDGKHFSLSVPITLLVRATHKHAYIPVWVAETQGGESVIQLPRDTFTTGSRVRVPSCMLVANVVS